VAVSVGLGFLLLEIEERKTSHYGLFERFPSLFDLDE